MSSFKEAYITTAGAEMMTKATANGFAIEFEKMVIGAGTYEDAEMTREVLQAQTGLKDQRQEFGFASITQSADKAVKLKTLINNKGLSEGYRVTEIGIIASIKGDTTSKSELYAIAIAEEADYLPEETTPITYIQEFYLKVDNAENVTINIEQGEYALAEDVQAINWPEFEEAEKLEVPESKESIFIIFGKIKKAITTLVDHIQDKDNPHKVSKKQVGLGEVPNVATNDQTPTYTTPTDIAELTSGENLSDAFGKIARAIKGYMSHILIKGSSSQSGHVKLTNSSAVTDATGLALAATEKNASIEGTLANQISVLNNNLTWTRVDISLQSSNTAWSEVIVSAPEILTAKEFCLFDSANVHLTPIFPALTDGYIQYSNGMGASDPYCISGQFRVYSNGRIGYAPSRIGTAAKAPKFTYLYYR